METHQHHPGLRRARAFYLSVVASVLLLGAGVFTFTACTNAPAGVVLSQDGAYNNDPVLVNFDEAGKAAFRSIDRILKWEETNRPWLSIHAPQVVSFAEDLETKAKLAFSKAAECRRLYAAAATVVNFQSISSAYDVIDLLVEAALLHYTQVNPQIRIP